MKHVFSTVFLILLAAASSPDVLAKGKQAPAKKEPDFCVVPPGAQPLLPAKLLPGMGTTKNFDVTTTSEEARKFFLQGVSQIHSFWFTESERSCLQALEYDPNMAMAHWCIALSAASDFRPAFQLMRDTSTGGPRGSGAIVSNEAAADATVTRTINGAPVDPQTRAKEAIARAMALRDTVTPRERLYIEAQAARRTAGQKDAADAAYIAAMRKLVAAYPDDLDAKSMLGLAIDNGFEPVGKNPRAETMEAIKLLEVVVAKDDTHFGAHHYLIHAYEGSQMPEKAWHASARYASLVTNIPHALHMPGHIYAQSDKVQEAISAFSAAAANEQKWIASDTLYPTGHYGHNVHFLIHALNLGGRYDDSMKWVQDLFTYKENPRERSFRDDGEVDVLAGVLGGAFELIEEGDARWTWALLERQERRLTTCRPRPLVAGIAREHEAVDHQTVLARLEQLRQFHVGGSAVGASAVKDVVLRNRSARWQRPP